MAITLGSNGQNRSGTLSGTTKSNVVLSGSDFVPTPQEKVVIPCDDAQVVKADKGCYLKTVTVQAVPGSYGRISYNGGSLLVW